MSGSSTIASPACTHVETRAAQWLRELGATIATSGEDVHGSALIRLADAVTSGTLSIGSLTAQLHTFACPQHLRPAIEKVTARIVHIDANADAINAKAAEIAARTAAMVASFDAPAGGRGKQGLRRTDAQIRRGAVHSKAVRQLERELAGLETRPRPARAPLDLSRMPFAKYVRTHGGSWYEVEKVNKSSVRVKVAPGMDKLRKFSQIIEIREHELPAAPVAGSVFLPETDSCRNIARTVRAKFGRQVVTSDSRIKVNDLENAPGTRILLALRHGELAGAGTGDWTAARKPKARRGSLSVPGEPAGEVHAATVLNIQVRRLGTHQGAWRYDVVTNLGTVKGVLAGQWFRIAPATMQDSVDIRAMAARSCAETAERKAHNLAHPVDVDGKRATAGDLVELIDQGGGGCAGRPCRITRMVCGNVMGAVVHRPYARAYDTYAEGEGLAPHATFRVLPGQDAAAETAVFSCGCPAPVDQPDPSASAVVGSDAWEAAHTGRPHLGSCPWAHGTSPRFVSSWAGIAVKAAA